MIFCRLRRAAALACALLKCAIHLGLLRLGGPLTLARRALWLQSAARGVLASLKIQVEQRGAAPAGGLVVANHLSYLDILAIAAVMPCFFIAKIEVSRWPFFGWAAQMGGTIFLKRGDLLSADQAANQIAARLATEKNTPVLLFPEGTSTDGSQVQRFHSRLFTPAVAASAPVTAAAIRYTLGDGAPERTLCWYGDATFLGHLWKVLAAGSFVATVSYGSTKVYEDRRTAANATRAEVEALRAAADASKKA